MDKGNAGNGFPGKMPLLGMTGKGGLSLQVYVGDVEKTGIGRMSVNQQEINNATHCHWETQ